MSNQFFMKFYLILLFVSIHSILVNGQTNTNGVIDTAKYKKVISASEIINFGYKYNNQDIYYEGAFLEIDNSKLKNIKEVYVSKLNQVIENSDGSPVYDRVADKSKIEKYVGFTINEKDQLFNYGLQKDILDSLKMLNKNDTILIFGKVSKMEKKNQYIINVKYFSKKPKNVISNLPKEESPKNNSNTLLILAAIIVILILIIVILFLKRKK